MAQFYRLDVLNEMIKVGVIPLFYHDDIEIAKKIITSCYEGGASVVEFTNRGDNAYRTFSDLVIYFKKTLPGLILGIGSVLDPGTASLYISSGANFVVGSVLNPEVAKICNRRKIAYIPGCATPSEISQAEELGVEIVKIYPADTIGGVKFVKAILAPTPWSRILPSGGVEPTPESLQAWFNAGVSVVGIGSNLVRKDWVQSGEFSKITDLTSQVIQWIKQARTK